MAEYQWILHRIITKEDIVVDRNEFHVGRDCNMQLVCVEKTVSRHHASFFTLSGNKLCVKDNKSFNGTFVNREKIWPYKFYDLKEGDEVGLGCYSGLQFNPNTCASANNHIYTIKVINAVPVHDKKEEVNLDMETKENALDNEIIVATKTNNIRACYVLCERLDIVEPLIENYNKDEPTDSTAHIQNSDLINLEDNNYNKNVQLEVNIKEEKMDCAENVNNVKELSSHNMEDGFIIIDDDDDEGMLQCSQLLDDNALRESRVTDSMFATIKTEIAELDRFQDTTVVRYVNLDDTDDDSDDFLFNIEEKSDKDKDIQPAASTSTSMLPPQKKTNLERKYSYPPIVSPHFEKMKKNQPAKVNTPTKRKSEAELNSAKMIKTTTFYKSETKILKNIKQNSSVQNKEINELRKQRLKEIELTKKQNNALKLSCKKERKSTVRVKDSMSRGNFLLENQPNNNAVVKLSKKSSTITSVSKKPPLCNNLPKESSTNIASSHVTSSVAQLSTSAEHFLFESVISHINKQLEGEVDDMLIKILNWNPVWLNEHSRNSGLPPIQKQPLCKMLKTYNSYIQYYDTVIPAMLVEIFDFLYTELTDAYKDRRKKKFVVRVDSETKRSKYTEIICYTYIDKLQYDSYEHLRKQDLVVIQYPVHNNRSAIVFGFVQSIKKKVLRRVDLIDKNLGRALEMTFPYAELQVKIILTLQTPPGETYKLMNMRIITSLTTSIKVLTAIKQLRRSALRDHILSPTLELYRLTPLNNRPICSKSNLNEEQQQAVTEVTHLCIRKEPGMFLLHGPPGTGKTTVIIQIITNVLFQHLPPKYCILVVAPTNAAIDELVLRLINTKMKFKGDYYKAMKLVRTGPANMIHPQVQAYSLLEMAKHNLYKDLLKHLQSKKKSDEVERDIATLTKAHKNTKEFNSINIGKICLDCTGEQFNESLHKYEDMVLRGAHIICTTLVSCAGSRMEDIFKRNGSKKKITCCIVDEATQTNEAETLIPLHLNIDKMVLVGDPKQLPGFTVTKELKECGFGDSLFSRIMSNFSNSNTPVRMLKTQYRMHPQIRKFPNLKFYNGVLRDDPNILKRKSPLNNLMPYLVFNLDVKFVNGEEYQNKYEIACIIKLLRVLHLQLKDSSVTVGIITPYNNQKQAIMNELKKETFDSFALNVNTVDSFQGQEKDIIIMSFVRNTANSFLKDKQRLNVALTRAKFVLYIIGCSNLFNTCEVLSEIQKNAIERRLMRSVKQTTTEAEFTKIITLNQSVN